MEGVADGVDGGEGPLGGQREGVLVLLQEREAGKKEETEGMRITSERLESICSLCAFFSVSTDMSPIS